MEALLQNAELVVKIIGKDRKVFDGDTEVASFPLAAGEEVFRDFVIGVARRKRVSLLNGDTGTYMVWVGPVQDNEKVQALAGKVLDFHRDVSPQSLDGFSAAISTMSQEEINSAYVLAYEG